MDNKYLIGSDTGLLNSLIRKKIFLFLPSNIGIFMRHEACDHLWNLYQSDENCRFSVSLLKLFIIQSIFALFFSN